MKNENLEVFTKMPDDYLTQAKFAVKCGVENSAVTYYRDKFPQDKMGLYRQGNGKVKYIYHIDLVNVYKKLKRGKNTKIDIEDIDYDVAEKNIEKFVRDEPFTPDITGDKELDLKIMKLHIEVQTKALDLQRARNQVLDIGATKAEGIRIAIAVKQGLASMIPRIKPILADMTNQHEIGQLLEKEIDKSLRVLKSGAFGLGGDEEYKE